MDFVIKKLDITNIPKELYHYCDQAKEQGMMNNCSLDAMKIGKWKNEKEAWWCTWAGDKIASISGCHSFNRYYPGSWRVLVRTGTLKQYRAKAPGNPKKMENDWNWGHILKHQYNYIKQFNPERIFFTTNVTGPHCDKNSNRTDRVVRKVLVKRGIVTLVEENTEIYSTYQNLWEPTKEWLERTF